MMEQASISQERIIRPARRIAARTMGGLAALIVAAVLVVVSVLVASDAGRTDRTMTDEVAKVKTGYMVSGDSKPHGGLPELLQQIKAADFAAAGTTVGGISRQSASARSELIRRGADLSAIDEFSARLDEAGSAIGRGDAAAAQESALAANRAWSGVEAALAWTQVDGGMLVRTAALLGLAWLLFAAGLFFLTERSAITKHARVNRRGSGAAAVEATGAEQEFGEERRLRGLNLTALRPLRTVLFSPAFPAACQAFGLVVMTAVLTVGIAGTAGNSESLAVVLTWSVWWSPLMILGLVLLGKLWCGACPLGAISAVVERLGLGRRAPTYARKYRLGLLTVTPLAASILGFIAMREPLFGSGYAVTSAPPFWTAFYLGIFVVGAVGVSLVYKRRAWCRNWCPVTVASSVVAKLSPLQLSHSQKSGVINCSTAEYPGNYLDTDKRCVYCMKCTQAYPLAPVIARLRLPGSAAVRDRKIFAEAVMALVVVAVFPIGHGLGALSLFKGDVAAQLRLSYFAAIAGTLLAYAAVSRLGAWLAREDFHDVFARYGVAFLPMGVLFSCGQAITTVLGKGGSWLNTVMPYFGVHGFWGPGIVSNETVAAWQDWSMAWLTAIGGLWALGIILAIARRHKSTAATWLPMAALVVFFVILAKALPMPMH